MAWTLDSTWRPQQLLAVGDSVDTSTGATEVMTDAGRAFIKPLGNRQGPHVLATDWVGTHLARWFGLTTFDIAILTLGADDVFPLPRGSSAQPGPAFASRAVPGEPWGRSGLQLDVLVNPADITRLVVFDTWTLNCDRCHHDATVRRPNPDNVFLSSEGVPAGKRTLLAIDHGLCFIRSGEELTAKLSNISKVKDENVFGLFPEFRGRLRQDTIEECTKRLRDMDGNTAAEIVATVPDEWDVSTEARAALSELITRRAAFVADHFEDWLETVAPWFGTQGD